MAVYNNAFTKTAAYPNQRVVKIVKEPTKQPFAQINIDVLNKAAKDLIPVYSAAFDLWIYFSKNQTDYEMTLSPLLITEDFGLSKDRYQRGFNVLQERGYLEEISKTRFIFHQVPDDKYKPKEKKSCLETETTLRKAKSCHETQDNPLKKNGEIQTIKASNSRKTILHNNTNSTDIVHKQQEQGVDRNNILDGYTLIAQTIDYNQAIYLINMDGKRFSLVGDYFYDSEQMKAQKVFRF